MKSIIFVYLTAAGLAASFATTTINAAEQDPPAPALAPIGLRIDCLHSFNRNKGGTQDCLNLSGLRYSQTQKVGKDVQARFRLDPFAALPGNKTTTPLRTDVPTVRDTDLLLIDDWALTWLPRPNLEVALENYTGATSIPDVSGLALSNPYADNGWRQVAVTVTYNLAALSDMRVKFAAGNGEGEFDKNLDPQQYFGFELSAALVQGLRGLIGVSLDGNNVGSAEYTWLTQHYQDQCQFNQAASKASLGHSTQRMAAGLLMDGTLAAAPGLKLGLGWQRQMANDTDRTHTASPKLADLQACPSIDPDVVFVESADGESANSMQRTIYNASIAYTLFDGFSLGADYSTRSLDSGSIKLFETCNSYADGRCTSASGATSNKLVQTSMSLGSTMRLAEGLDLTLEYATASYDKKYTQLFYLDKNGKTSETQELFNARVAYNWH